MEGRTVSMLRLLNWTKFYRAKATLQWKLPKLLDIQLNNSFSTIRNKTNQHQLKRKLYGICTIKYLLLNWRCPWKWLWGLSCCTGLKWTLPRNNHLVRIMIMEQMHLKSIFLLVYVPEHFNLHKMFCVSSSTSLCGCICRHVYEVGCLCVFTYVCLDCPRTCSWMFLCMLMCVNVFVWAVDMYVH